MILINKARDVSEIGGKAYNLLSLNMPDTPPLWVIPKGFFDECKEDSALYVQLETDLEAKLKNDTLYAVRSSAVDEDSEYASFAGVHRSFLNVPKKDVREHIFKVYESAFSENAMSYRRTNGLKTENIGIAVIIQEMVEADISGVAFSINPVTNNPDEVIVSVTEGLGEHLVDGSVSGTTYTVNGENVKHSGKELLTDKQLQGVLKMLRMAEEKLGAFSDVEFSLKGDKVYFLQARPIVAYKGIDPKKRTLLIDNSNIIESYYGVTSPLTFTFAKDVYRDVYTATVKAGKVRRKLIEELKPSLSEMLYRHEGRIYYNMNSWYHVNSIFSSKKTTSRMEGMMGVKSSADGEKRLRLNLFDKVRLGIALVSRLVRLESLSRRFDERFEEIISPYYGKEIHGTNDELKSLFCKIESDIVPEFVIPIVNDCAVMIYFGKLRDKAKKLGISEKELNGYISNRGDVMSVGSATDLVGIIKDIKKDGKLLYDFTDLSPDELLKKYGSNNAISEKIGDYVREYGARVGDELKLETVTMIEDKTMVYGIIKQNLSTSFEQPSYAEVPIPKKIRRSVEKTKKYIKIRERLRIKRTKIYSVVRNIFLAYGKNYCDMGKLDCVDDVFFLTKEEVFSGEGDLRSLVRKRRKQDEENAKKPTFDRVVFYGDRVLAVRSSEGDGELCGIPTGAGKVRAPVRVMHSPTDTLLQGEIILTERTDPGWISLFPRAAGLIVEHGSMLSHSFVVAREMNLPAVVGIEGVVSKIPNGAIVTLDGVRGVLTVEQAEEVR
ncbi:MAG: hypothetical protein IJN17_01895 [Clostridia bacterium]|nr:hypothetical protein [Clostridia bacterium]